MLAFKRFGWRKLGLQGILPSKDRIETLYEGEIENLENFGSSRKVLNEINEGFVMENNGFMALPVREKHICIWKK